MAKKRKTRRGWGCLLFLLLAAGIWMALQFAGLDGKTVVALDPGHGGEDPGASGIVEEVELTETTVRYLQEYLEQDAHYEVYLCREYGEGKGLNRRWAGSILHGADLLLCVHGNSAEDPSARGFEAYPSLPGSRYHAESVRFARLIAEEIAATGVPLRGDGGIRYAYYREQEDGSSPKILLDAPDPALEGFPTFAMVQYPRCPAVLAEQCFVTNADDISLLGTEEGCRLAAECYYRAICEYFETEPVI